MEDEVKKLREFIETLIKVGNAMSIKTGAYPCAKHYQKELKDWADMVSEYNRLEENK